MFAYVPARGGSKRIPRKNIRSLAGRPVIEHTIDQLLNSGEFTQVFVSTDDEEIRHVARNAGASCLNLRSEELSGDEVGFIELIHHDMPRFSRSANDRDAMLVLPTSALVPASIYRDASQVFCSDRPNVLMSVGEYPVSPLWAMFKKPDGFLCPTNPQFCFTASKDLPTTFMDAGLFYAFNLDAMKSANSLKVIDRLQAFVVDDRYSVDVDWPRDFKVLEKKHQDLQQDT